MRLLLLAAALVLVATASATDVPTIYTNSTCSTEATKCTQKGTALREINRLTFTAESGSRYVCVFNGQLRLNSTSSFNMGVEIWNATDSPRRQVRVIHDVAALAERVVFSHFDVHEGTGATVTYNISINASLTNNITAQNVVSSCIRVDNLDGTQYNYTYDDSESINMDNVFGDDTADTINLTITPSQEGDYLILASAISQSGATGQSDRMRLNITNSSASEIVPVFGTILIEARSTTSWYPASVAILRHLEATRQDIKLQYADEGATASADWRGKRIIVLRLSDAFLYNASANISMNTTREAGWHNSTELNISSGYWLLFGSQTLNYNSTAQQIQQFLVERGGTMFNNMTEQSKDLTDTYHYTLVGVTNISGGETRFIQLQRRRTGTDTIVVSNAEIIALLIRNETAVVAGGEGASCSACVNDQQWSLNISDNCVIDGVVCSPTLIELNATNGGTAVFNHSNITATNYTWGSIAGKATIIIGPEVRLINFLFLELFGWW